MIETTIAGFPALRGEGQPGRPTVLLLHGSFATHQSWAGWAEELERAGWPVVAPSLSGRLGVGPERARGLKFADYLADTLKVLDALGEKPIVVGHSLGGLLAQKLAELGRVRAAVLVAPAPAGKLTAQPVALPAYLPMMPRILVGAPVRPACSACERIALNCIPDENARRQIHDGLVHESGAVYREMIFGSVKVDAAKVTCPIYVMGGKQDRIVAESLMRATAERYRAELKLWDEHAHFILGEPGWQRVAADAIGWIERSMRSPNRPVRREALEQRG